MGYISDTTLLNRLTKPQQVQRLQYYLTLAEQRGLTETPQYQGRCNSLSLMFKDFPALSNK